MFQKLNVPVFRNTCYIQVKNIQLNSNLGVSFDDHISIQIGPKNTYKNFSVKTTIKGSYNIQKQWAFSYKRAETSSFIISVSKTPLFGEPVEIAKSSIQLADFAPDYVTEKIIKLHQKNGSVIGTASLRVHLSEDGSEPFIAPLDSGKKFDNIRVFAPNFSI